jgi:hypothetical protein
MTHPVVVHVLPSYPNVFGYWAFFTGGCCSSACDIRSMACLITGAAAIAAASNVSTPIQMIVR